MSLAADLLKRAGVTPRQLVQPTRQLHLARVPGVTRMRDKWRAAVTINHQTWQLGDYTDVRRAVYARRMWDYWLAKGYPPEDIPRLTSKAR